jgi:outer membrane biosynthesis protein TonB
MTVMKRQRTGRVLHFAVTGALLGGVGIGCNKHRTIVNTERADEPPTQPSVNPGPEVVDAPDQTPVEPEPDYVNEGPVDQPPTDDAPAMNVVKEPEPEPEPKHVNVRKQPEPKPKPKPKHVNVVKELEPE